ncbi:c2h2 finger domain containing protein [Niveomyces insectorum RCEF 264]|uniref:C2h2 finger domain containing protein n=1 Tax=Niveomyces insectorum RCEF 264 TaxID=1081102 RepID=A0A167X6Q5_9HYPO|nr:c2h2 finger domain containing protein [Niveomyces insectorum RCEF 264]
MPKAEIGSVKHLNKQMKARGLTRLRWYCQVCERAMRDENAFKQHTLSESHVRNMLAVGSDARKVINEYSDQFLKDFLQLLRTGHGEKQVHINQFYQEYIARREHIHMNATRWTSLTDLAKYLGREGICRVEENDKGLFISWIDTSPEALRRQEALRRKEAQDRGDEEWERRMLKAQIERAKRATQERKKDNGTGAGDGDGDDNNGTNDKDDEEARERKYRLQREEGEKVKLSFGTAKPQAPPSAALQSASSPDTGAATLNATTADAMLPSVPIDEKKDEKRVSSSASPAAPKSNQTNGAAAAAAVPSANATPPTANKPMALKLGGLSKPQPKNVFAAAKKNALVGGSGGKKIEMPKKMSEVERIMKEELERKRARESRNDGHGGFRFGGPPNKKPRY